MDRQAFSAGMKRLEDFYGKGIPSGQEDFFWKKLRFIDSRDWDVGLDDIMSNERIHPTVKKIQEACNQSGLDRKRRKPEVNPHFKHTQFYEINRCAHEGTRGRCRLLGGMSPYVGEGVPMYCHWHYRHLGAGKDRAENYDAFKEFFSRLKEENKNPEAEIARMDIPAHYELAMGR